MVMSVETGIYIPNKMGIRLEDVVVVTDAGPHEIFVS
jgi:Xaa-Pro aminopeptidase